VQQTFGKAVRVTTFDRVISRVRNINKILATHFVSVCRLPRRSKDIAADEDRFHRSQRGICEQGYGTLFA